MSRRRLLLSFFAVLLIFLPGYLKLQELKAKNRSLLDRIEELKSDNVKLGREIDRLENDPFYIEKKARDKMGIARKGEIRYKVIDEDEEPNE